jgi:uncharacterized coiled-coil DUF342 family protein
MDYTPPTDEKLQEWLNKAHVIKNALLRPIEERQAAALAISESIMAAAEYRAQRDALRTRVAQLEEQIRGMNAS